jgi:hypothetical protein
VPRRNLVPLVLLVVLGALALAFAFVGASAAPSGATLTVQNASSTTFGSPTGSTSWTMDVVASVSAGTGSGTVSQVRQIRYAPPHRMAVYQVSPGRRLLRLLSPAAITCALSSYTSLVGGSTPWTPSGNGSLFARTESLADFSSRVPAVNATTCEPRTSTTEATVRELASVRAGYLVGVRFTIVVTPKTLPNGRVTHGTENEALVMIEINGARTRDLGP